MHSTETTERKSEDQDTMTPPCSARWIHRNEPFPLLQVGSHVVGLPHSQDNLLSLLHLLLSAAVCHCQPFSQNVRQGPRPGSRLLHAWRGCDGRTLSGHSGTRVLE
ncbi:hypothetical protein G4228_000933 [Cervus hanglu yarkandensis]|nr:hypothetical protein G4228_000933 [Cervus hanglu yarkandensis]